MILLSHKAFQNIISFDLHNHQRKTNTTVHILCIKKLRLKISLNNLPHLLRLTAAAEDALGRAPVILFLSCRLPPQHKPFPESWQKWLLIMANISSVLSCAKHCDDASSHQIPTIPQGGCHAFTQFMYEEVEV